MNTTIIKLELDAITLTWLTRFAKNRHSKIEDYVLNMVKEHKDYVLNTAGRKTSYYCSICGNPIGFECKRLYIVDSVTYKTTGVPRNSESFDQFFSERIFPPAYTSVFKIGTCEHLKEYLPETRSWHTLKEIHETFTELIRLGAVKQAL